MIKTLQLPLQYLLVKQWADMCYAFRITLGIYSKTMGKYLTDDTAWFLPKNYKQSKDRSKKYVVSETQLRKLFAMKFAPLDFNRDFVNEFIEEEKLNVQQ